MDIGSKKIEKYLIIAAILAVAIMIIYSVLPKSFIEGVFPSERFNLTVNINGSHVIVPIDIGELRRVGETTIKIGDVTYNASMINGTILLRTPAGIPVANFTDPSMKLGQCETLLFAGGVNDSYSFATNENGGTAIINSESEITGKESLPSGQTATQAVPAVSVIEPSGSSPNASAVPTSNISAVEILSRNQIEYVIRETRSLIIFNTSAGTLQGNTTKKAYLDQNTFTCVLQTVNGNVGKKKVSDVAGCENTLPNYNPYTLCADDMQRIRSETISVKAGVFNTVLYQAKDGAKYWASDGVYVPIKIQTNVSITELVSYEKK